MTIKEKLKLLDEINARNEAGLRKLERTKAAQAEKPTKSILLPLKVAQCVAAMFLSVGCFLGFPNDAQLAGAFWAVTAVMVIAEVIDGAQERRRKR